MSASREELRHDLLAVLNASRELSPDVQPYLIEGFLDRLVGQSTQRRQPLVGVSSKLRRPSHLVRKAVHLVFALAAVLAFCIYAEVTRMDQVAAALGALLLGPLVGIGVSPLSWLVRAFGDDGVTPP